MSRKSTITFWVFLLTRKQIDTHRHRSKPYPRQPVAALDRRCNLRSITRCRDKKYYILRFQSYIVKKLIARWTVRVLQTAYWSAGGERNINSLKHEVNVSNGSGRQLFPAIISKDSDDAKRYSSKAWNGTTEITLLYCSRITLSKKRISQLRSGCTIRT